MRSSRRRARTLDPSSCRPPLDDNGNAHATTKLLDSKDLSGKTACLAINGVSRRTRGRRPGTRAASAGSLDPAYVQEDPAYVGDLSRRDDFEVALNGYDV